MIFDWFLWTLGSFIGVVLYHALKGEKIIEKEEENMTPRQMCDIIFELCKEHGYEKVETTVLSILETAKDYFEEKEK